MKVEKYIVYIQIVLSFSLFTSATDECEESSKNIEDAIDQNLNIIRPLRYQVYVNPCIKHGNFSGYVNIDLFVLESTKNISLHSRNLEFCEGVYLTQKGGLNDTFKDLKSITNMEYGEGSFQDSDELLDNSSETVKPSEFVYYKKQQIIVLKFENYIKPARYSLEINYMGTVNSEPVGIYRRFYKDVDGSNKPMLLTNFFPNSARQIFPCRDEPEMKSELYFTMQTSLNFTTIMANTPNNYVEYKEGQRWSHFHPIMNSSTYQLNFAVVRNMKNATKVHENKTYITYAAAQDLNDTKLAQDTYGKAMTIMENYIEIKYPLDTFTTLVTSDKIEIPTSSSLGFITIKKSQASYSEQAGPVTKKNIIFQATRDITNQWFSQLISPASWQYLWLTEGIAEYMKYYIADKIMPEWRLQDIFVVWELQRRSFIPNKISDSPPLSRNIPNHPAYIQCLLSRSVFSTSMSASIMRMISHFLSEDILRSSIKHFLKIHMHKAVKSNDFWDAIQNAISASKDQRLSNINISQIMETWTNAEFYPIVNVTRNYATGSMKLTQIPAVTFFGLTKRNITNKWWIPINYASQTKPFFNTTIASHWLNPNINNLTIDNIDSKDWVILNVQQTGYYRVLYDQENWKRLATYLNSENYLKIHPVNRAQIMNDAMQFALKQQLDMNTFFNILCYLRREVDYIPWYDAQFIFSFLNYHLSNTKAYNSFKKFSLHIIIPLVDKIGYEDRPDDDFSTLLLRRISNHWACYFGYERCWNNATKKLEAYLDNERSVVDSDDLQQWARCIGLNGADETIWNKVWKKYEEHLSQDALIYLACSENITILNQFLNLTIVDNSIIPENQVLSVYKSVCLYPSGDDKRMNLCLKFIDDNFDKIKLRLGNSTQPFIYFLDLLASEIRQKSQLETLTKLLAEERAAFAVPKLKARINQTESRIIMFEQKATYYEPFLILCTRGIRSGAVKNVCSNSTAS